LRRALAIALLIIAVAACGSQEDAVVSEGNWVGTITTEGAVTTVVNESGSVWGGTATLMEEVSIGIGAGDEPYMFGEVAGVGVVADRIFVLDRQVARVRVYDEEGEHLFDMGSEGGGPGEFRDPFLMAVSARLVYVRDRMTNRITVFTSDGALVETWPAPRVISSVPIVATMDGTLFASVRGTMVPWGPDGAVGEGVPFGPDAAARPPTMTVQVTEAIPGYSAGAMIARVVPFWPEPAFAMSPTGAMITGVGDEYRFAVEHADRSTTAVTRTSRELVRVRAPEAAWHRARISASLSRADGAWQWDGPEIPDVKPAFTEFVPAVSGELWVVRPGPGYQDTNCEPYAFGMEAPETCWKDTRIVDVFGADGRFHGQVDVPERFRLTPRPFIRANTVVGIVENEAGTIMVKRYRLVLPGEQRP